MSVARQLLSTGTSVPSLSLSGPVAATTGPVSYSTLVSGSDGTPTGTVTISDTLASCTVSLDGSGGGSCQLVESAALSPYSVTATYNGDGTYESLTATISETVGLALPAAVLTGVAGSGGVVTYDVTVSGPQGLGVPVPTGTVTVNDSNGGSCTTATLDSNGSGTCQITESASFTATATYIGDLNYISTTVLLTPTVMVTDNSLSVSAGGLLTFTATVAGPGAALTPTGSVAWTLTGPNSPACSSSTLSSGGTATCTVSDVVAGAYGATAVYGGDSNYAGSSGVDTTATIGPALLTITASSGSFTYGGTPPPIGPSYAGFVNGDSPASLTTQASCSTTAESSSPVSGSPYPSSCSGASDPDYNIVYVGGSVTVKKAPLKLTASNGSMTYGGSPPTITVAAYAGFVNGDSESSLTTAATCSTAATSSSPVSGSPYSSSCSGAVDSNYKISYVAGSVTVSPATLSITASDGSMTYGGSSPVITAGYSGFVNGDSASSLGTKPTCSTAATSSSSVVGSPYSSSCTGAADSNYTIGYMDGSVTVSPAALSITASDGSMTYGGSPPAITAGYSGFVNGDSASRLSTKPTCSTTAISSSSVMGSPYPSSCAGAADSNYTIGYLGGFVTVNPATLTVTASDGSMTYGGTAPTITVVGYSGFVNGDSASSLSTKPTCSTKATSSSSVAGSPYGSSCSGAADSNYTFKYVSGSVTVSAAPLSITASNGSMTYGGSSPAITAGYSGFVNGDSASSLSTTPTCSTKASGASSVAGSPYASSCSGAADSNYSISYSGGSVTVSPASLTITAASQSFTYGSSPHSVTALYAGFVNGDGAGNLTSEPACSTTATTKSTVSGSPYPSSCSGAAEPNYSISYTPGSVTVNPAALAITASDGSMTYGGTPPTITVVSYSGFVNGDSASSLGVQATCSTAATSSSPVSGSPYKATCSSAFDPNYDITYVAGSVKVSSVALAITASNATTTYGSAPAVIASYAGFVNGESASSLTTPPKCSSTDTGSSSVAGSPYASSCSGAVDTNYSISYAKGSVTVDAAALNITASSGSFTYGGTSPAIVAVYSGFVNGDSASSLTTSPSCSGTVDSNYTATYVAGTVTINQATPMVTVSGQSGQSTGKVMVSVTITGPKGAGAPTGSVTVTDLTSKCSISSLDANGDGQCALIENASEDGKNVTASYSGDTNYVTASANTTESVSPSTPTVTLSGPSSAVTGHITYNATVAGQGALPTGTVVISDGTNSCTSNALSQAIGACSLQEATGTYQVTAKYTGDSNYLAATGGATEVVNESATSLTVSSATIVYGLEQTTSFSVTVTWPPGAPTPTGASVAVMAGSQTLCVAPLTLTYVTVVNPVSGVPNEVPEDAGSCTTTPGAVPAGTYSVTAEFAGVTALVGSTSPPAALTVESAPTSTSLTVSRRSTTYGNESDETIVTKVGEPSAGDLLVTGSVEVLSGTQLVCIATLNQGVGTCKLASAQLAIGRHSFTAEYGGTTSLVASSSGPVSVLVDKALTTSALSLSDGVATFGHEQHVKFSARVGVPRGMSQTPGTVLVKSGSKRLCVIDLVHGKGSCSLGASELLVGRYSISAQYQGSNKLQVSVSRKQTLTITKPTTSHKKA